MNFSITSYLQLVMKPGFHLWMLKPNNSQCSGCTNIHQTSRKHLNKRCLLESWWQLFSWTGKGCWWWNSCNKGPQCQKCIVKLKKKLHKAIQNKRRRMLTYSAVLLHDNACLHTAAHTLALLARFNWELFDHRPYSPDLPPVDYHINKIYHLFTYPKNWLWWQHFNNNELLEGIIMWQGSQAADFFDTGIQKLIPQCYKCLSSGGDYDEK
jgi:hypothetical protein